jgi:hypothetical protein
MHLVRKIGEANLNIDTINLTLAQTRIFPFPSSPMVWPILPEGDTYRQIEQDKNA